MKKKYIENFEIVLGDVFDYKADALVVPALVTPPTVEMIESNNCIEAELYKQIGISKLLEKRESIGPIEPGDAVVFETEGLMDNYKYLIFTPTPFANTEESYDILRNCYHNSMEKARKLKCKSIVFPLLATGQCDLPREDSLSVAESEIKVFQSRYCEEMNIKLVLFSGDSFNMISFAMLDLSGSTDEVKKILAENKEEFSKVNFGEMAEYYAFLQNNLKIREEMEVEDLEQESDSEFDFCEYARVKMKELGYSFDKLADMTRYEVKTIRRTINGETSPTKMGEEFLLKLGYCLHFDLYQMNSTLAHYGFPELKIGKLDKIQAGYYYCFKHYLYDYKTMEEAIENNRRIEREHEREREEYGDR